MMIFDESTYRMTYTPWGSEVKTRLIKRHMKQNDLVKYLTQKGFDITKGHLTNLLKGIGASNRKGEIAEISRFLEIPIREEE